MKNFCDMEKEKMELRISEEKERAARKAQSLTEELEQRVIEETREKELEVEVLHG